MSAQGTFVHGITYPINSRQISYEAIIDLSKESYDKEMAQPNGPTLGETDIHCKSAFGEI